MRKFIGSVCSSDGEVFITAIGRYTEHGIAYDPHLNFYCSDPESSVDFGFNLDLAHVQKMLVILAQAEEALRSPGARMIRELPEGQVLPGWQG